MSAFSSSPHDRAWVLLNLLGELQRVVKVNVMVLKGRKEFDLEDLRELRIPKLQG